MTNVMNSTNPSVSTAGHCVSITQSDDLISSLSSLSFNESGANESEAPITLSTPSGSNCSVTAASRRVEDASLHDLPSNLMINNNTVDAKDLTSDTLENHQKIQSQTIKNSEILNALTSSSPNNGTISSKAMSTLPNYEYPTSSNDNSVSAMWSNVDDGSNHNLSSNGYKNNVNYTNSPISIMNNSNMQQQQMQQNRRAITASHGCFQPGSRLNTMPSQNHHLPAGQFHKHNTQDQSIHQQQHSMPQQVQHHAMNYHQLNTERDMMGDHQRHAQKFGSNYPLWSNPQTTVAWSQPQHSHQQMPTWNRGRSVPNLNPISNTLPHNRKPTSPNTGMSGYGQAPCGIQSPMKYRRSTSFPVKGLANVHGNIDVNVQGQNNLSHGPLDVNVLDDAREQFIQYQVSKLKQKYLKFIDDTFVIFKRIVLATTTLIPLSTV